MHSRLAMHILINSIWEGWLEKEKSMSTQIENVSKKVNY